MAISLKLAAEIAAHRMVTVKEASEIIGVSDDTFRRRHRDLIQQVSARRQSVRLGDVLAIAEQSKA
jgi:DeoR/GlpR family transcriptional regulator of sugar metabolism